MSRVVFVGNVPYNMGEEQLIEVFQSVGQVKGFRLVFDRETGKAKGYGFCEFADHETALSAVRNLNNTDVGGRPLRIDLADSDPFLEGKTTVRGEILDGGYPGPAEPRSNWNQRGPKKDTPALSGNTSFMNNLPKGRPLPKGMSALDSITSTLANLPPGQVMEILSQMKAYINNHPEQAKLLLQKHPQLSYALFQALLLHNIVPAEVLTRMHSGGSFAGPPPPNTYGGGPAGGMPGVPPPMNRPPVAGGPPPPPHMGGTPGPYGAPPPGMGPPYAAGPPGQGYPPPPQAYPAPSGPGGYPPPPPSAGGYPPYNRGPPAGGLPPPLGAPGVVQQPQAPPAPQSVAAAAAAAGIDDSQREMIMTLLNMSQEAINALPENQRAGVMQLRTQFMGLASNS